MALNNNTNICIKSEVNNKYLRFETGTSIRYGLLQFAADSLFDPYVQIEVVKTDDTVTDLVHLKSRFNNRYLIRWDPESNWISASSEFPESDETSWPCTLFKPILIQQDGDTKKLQFQHVQSGYYLTLGSAPNANFLYANPTKRDTFTVIDWDSVVCLPMSYVCLFSNSINFYLKGALFE